MSFLFILGIIIWIAVAFWPAVIAKNKGYNFFLFFFISIFFWWITLFVVFGLKDKNPLPSSPTVNEG